MIDDNSASYKDKYAINANATLNSTVAANAAGANTGNVYTQDLYNIYSSAATSGQKDAAKYANSGTTTTTTTTTQPTTNTAPTSNGGNGNGYSGGSYGGGGGSPAAPAYNPYAADATHGTANPGIQLQSYTADTEGINNLYQQRQDANLLALENAYNASMASAQNAAKDIPQTYVNQENATEATAMQRQRAFNEAAAANGLNVGTASQAQLTQNNALQGELSSIRAQRANAEAQAQFNLQQLEQNYQSSVAEAIANNEYEKAQTLMNAYEKERESQIDTANKQAQLNQAAMETRAAQLAQYGDFSAYAELGYSADEIKAMFNAWKAANPSMYKAIYGGGSSGGNGWSVYNSPQGAFTRDLLANSDGYTQNQVDTAIQNYVADNKLTGATATAMSNYYTQLLNKK